MRTLVPVTAGSRRAISCPRQAGGLRAASRESLHQPLSLCTPVFGVLFPTIAVNRILVQIFPAVKRISPNFWGQIPYTAFCSGKRSSPPAEDSHIGHRFLRNQPKVPLRSRAPRKSPKARETIPLTISFPYGRRGEAKLRRKFFAKLSFKKAGVGWNFSDFVLYYLLQFFRKPHFPT